MKKKSSYKDPFAKREAQKYDHPVPSRELIMEYLDKLGHPVSFKRILSDLEITDEDEEKAIGYRLKAMLRDGQLLQDRRNRFCLVERLELIPGTVTGHPDGYGFLIPDHDGSDLFLSAKEMRKVFHGDRVLVREIGVDRRGRREGAIHEVIEHNTDQIVGRFILDRGLALVEPENKRISQTILIPAEDTLGARDGQIVMVGIVRQPNRHAQPMGRVMEILGDHMAPGMEIEVAIRAGNVPYAWSHEVIEEAKAFSETLTKSDLAGRKDLRDLHFVTIDGEDARDFDDAVYCEQTGRGGWRLLVAIADVSHYVRLETAIDQEAIKRGNSVYFPERVIPMLPEVLSNGLCSLNPKVDRLCMVCDVSLTAAGKIKGFRFYDAVMHSHERLTYTKVAAMLVDDDQALQKQHQHVWPQLQSLYALFKILHEGREKRGAIDFDTTETRIVFGADRKIENIVPVVRNDAHRLIEECMLLANVCAASFLLENKIPALYRVHAPPNSEKVTELRSFLAELGLSLGGGKKPKPKDYAQLLLHIHDRPDFHLIQTVLLRSLSQASYSPDNVGHFGLAFDAYTHFTSPIRRYPDLIVHRAIRYLLSGQDVADYAYTHNDMENLGAHCSSTERRADEATWDAIGWLKCEYMRDRVGQTYDGIISSVTNFGIFVELQNVFVEGLVHITSLIDDYYQYDSAKHRLRGQRTGTTYRLGDKIRVLVSRVNLDERKIDFDLAPR